MAARESCVIHPPGDNILFIRKSYVKIFDGDVCMAALVALFEYWTNGELSRFAKNGEEGIPWVQVGISTIEDWMMGLYSRRTIQEKLTRLDEFGLLKSTGPVGRNYKSYLLDVNTLNLASGPGFSGDIFSIGKIADQVSIGKKDTLMCKTDVEIADRTGCIKSLGNKEREEELLLAPPSEEKQNQNTLSTPLDPESFSKLLASKFKTLKGSKVNGEVKKQILARVASVAGSYDEETVLAAFDEFAEADFWADYDTRHRVNSFFASLESGNRAPRIIRQDPQSVAAAGAEAPHGRSTGDTGTPTSGDGLKTDFPAEWNRLVPAATVVWHSVRDEILGRAAFADPDFATNFEMMARKCQQMIEVRGVSAGWLTFRWLLKENNWWRVASGEYDWMLRPDTKALKSNASPSWASAGADRADARRKERHGRQGS